MTAVLTAPSPMQLHSDSLSVARLPFKRACSLASRCRFPLCAANVPNLLQVHAAAGAAGPGHPARRVERQPDGARLHDEQHDQRAGSRVVCVVCFFPPTAAAGASLVSSSLPSRQVLPLLSPCATASPLVESLVEPQVCALFQVQHNGQRRRQRAAAARRYTLLLQAFRPGHTLPPSPKIKCDPGLILRGSRCTSKQATTRSWLRLYSTLSAPCNCRAAPDVMRGFA